MFVFLQAIPDVLFILLVTTFLTALYHFFDDKNWKITFLVIFSSIFLHELAHKAVAYHFGYVSFIQTDLNLTYMAIAIFTFLMTRLLIPPPIYTYTFAVRMGAEGLRYSYIEPYTVGSVIHQILIYLAGPMINLILFVFAFLVLYFKWYDTEFEEHLFKVLFMINLFLFITNIVPIMQGSDGYQIFNLLHRLMVLKAS